MKGCCVHFVFSRWEHTHQRHVRDPVDLQDGMNRNDAAGAVRNQATQQRDVAPVKATSNASQTCDKGLQGVVYLHQHAAPCQAVDSLSN